MTEHVYLGDQHCGERCPVLDISGDLRTPFRQAIQNYQPFLPGLELEEEGGITEVSLNNLRAIHRRGATLNSVVVGPSDGCGPCIFFKFGNGINYIATGFGIGYYGEGPRGLAQFGSECGLGTFEDLWERVTSLPKDFQGQLWVQ